MDLVCERSASKSSLVEDDDNDVTSVAHLEDVHNTSNGNGDKIGHLSTVACDSLSSDESKSNQSDKKVEVLDTGFGQMLNSPPTAGKLKGKGLRKWKRLRRDFVSDSRSNVDSSHNLKRCLNNSENSTKPSHLSVEGEGSVGSAHMQSKKPENGEYLFHGSSSDSRLAAGSVFAAGNDSENSEDRSSKSSTAASAPKMRYQKPEINNLGRKGLGYSFQRTQKGKSSPETAKKQRGERVKTEKENSHSSMESDSRSSNFVFMQGVFSANSNGKQSGRDANYDEENSDGAQANEQHFTEDLQTGYNVENVDKYDDLSEDDLATGSSSWKAKSNENPLPSTDNDPLVNSVLTLQSVQEALEQELHKLEEIGRENGFESTERDEIERSHSDNIEKSASTGSPEGESINLTHKVNSLEGELVKARETLKAKELRVSELEAALHHYGNLQKEEIETELESLFLQKIEAEVEYTVIVKKMKNLKTVSNGQTALVEEQKSLVGKQKQMRNEFEEAESKAKSLEKQAEVLETYCSEILETEEDLKKKNRVFKVTGCFSLQLVLLVVFCWLFVLQQFSPQSGEVVPT